MAPMLLRIRNGTYTLSVLDRVPPETMDVNAAAMIRGRLRIPLCVAETPSIAWK